MNTPYEVFRNKKKMLKDQLHKTILHPKPELTIETSARAHTSDKSQSSRKTSFNKRVRNVKS